MHATRTVSTRGYSVDVPAALESGLPSTDSYVLGFARNTPELRAAQRLRFLVFNEELNEGLEESRLNGIDQDAFDDQCFHLVVRCRKTEDVVGTYRMQTLEMATAGIGFYSASVFDFSHAPTEIMAHSVELGRACIHPNHRSLMVLYLLWKGVGHFIQHFNKTHLFGCCSLSSQDENEGWGVLHYLQQHAHIHPSLSVLPLRKNMLRAVQPKPVNSITPPRLMRAYLSLGAKICSPPAIDREFKTIDFLAFFDSSVFNSSDSAFFHLKP